MPPEDLRRQVAASIGTAISRGQAPLHHRSQQAPRRLTKNQIRLLLSCITQERSFWTKKEVFGRRKKSLTRRFCLLLLKEYCCLFAVLLSVPGCCCCPFLFAVRSCFCCPVPVCWSVVLVPPLWSLDLGVVSCCWWPCLWSPPVVLSVGGPAAGGPAFGVSRLRVLGFLRGPRVSFLRTNCIYFLCGTS